MSFLEAMRSRARVRPPFRREPVLVVPSEAGPERIEAYVRQWCPDVVRRTDMLLEIPEGFDVLGPFRRGDDANWPDHALPARYTAAYVTKLRSVPDDWSNDTRYSLLYGLARRLSGQVRDKHNRPWSDPADSPVGLTVQASRRISHEELLRLVAPYFPGYQGKAEEPLVYFLSDSLWLCPNLFYPSTYPLARLRYSSTRPRDLVEYEFELDTTDPAELQRIADAASAIAVATGGIMLDAEGFPWQ